MATSGASETNGGRGSGRDAPAGSGGGGLNARTVRRSLAGAALGGGVFGAVSLYRSWVAGGPLLDYLGPVSIMVVIGATVGGLAGPLVGRAIARGRSRRKRTGDEASDGRAGEEEPRQPLWATLIVGVVIGYGIGTAWQRPVAGVVLGVVLALSSHRIFR